MRTGAFPIFSLILPSFVNLAFCQENQISLAPPDGEKQVPEMTIEDRVVHTLPSRSITILRGAPSPNVDTPAQTGSDLPALMEEATLQQEGAAEDAASTSELLPISATVYDLQLSCIQWTNPLDGKAYEAWSKVDFNLFAGLACVEAQGKKWALMQAVENVDSSRVDPATGALPQIPEHPAIPLDGPGFVVVNGNQADQAAVAPIAALHELHRTQSAQLAVSAAEHRRKQEEW